jgi:hypothetical protein
MITSRVSRNLQWRSTLHNECLVASDHATTLHNECLVASDHAGRLIHAALALYLLPALLVVLAVGVVGIIMLAFGRLFIVPVRKYIL